MLNVKYWCSYVLMMIYVNCVTDSNYNTTPSITITQQDINAIGT